FSWPWLNLGNGFSDYISWVQWYEFTGTFGGTLWVWIVNLGIFKSYVLYNEFNNKTILFRGSIKTASYILLPIIISLSMYYSYEETGETVNAIVLQPNIDPYSEKYNVSNDEIATLLFELTDSKITPETDFVISPETVFADNERIEIFETGATTQSIRDFISAYPNLN